MQRSAYVILPRIVLERKVKEMEMYRHTKFMVALFAVLVIQTVFSMSVTFYGGAERVGGSCAMVDNGETRMLVDCGAFMGDEMEFRGDNVKVGAFPFDPCSISVLFLTHAHQDHTGRVPDLMYAGFSGRILTTEPTKCLLREAWKSNIFYASGIKRNWRWSSQKRNHKQNRVTMHWREDCSWSKKIHPKNLGKYEGTHDEVIKYFETSSMSNRVVSGCRTCRENETEELLKRVECVRFGETNKFDEISVVFSPVQHLPGAAAIRFEDKDGSCIFSGDLGTHCSRLVHDIQPAEKSDVVFVEATYGSATGYVDKAESEYGRFREYVGAALRRDELVWIPAFAMDRTQRILFEIQKGIDAGEIPEDIPIYVLSPSARAMTDLYVSNAQWFLGVDTTNIFNSVAKRIQGSLDFNKVSKLTRAIIVTTSGMMDAAMSYQLLPKLVPRNDVSICIVGYQSPGTPGYKLLKKEKILRVRPSGRWFTVKVGCKAERFTSFSGHADASEVDNWLSNNKQSKIYLIHGSTEALENRRKDLTAKLGSNVEIARPGVTYTIRRNIDKNIERVNE